MNWKLTLKSWMEKQDRDDRGPRKRGVLFLGAVVASVAAILLMGGYAFAQKTVTVVVDGKEATVRTFSSTVSGVLKAQNVVLLEKDEVTPSADTRLKDGTIVTVNRAVDLNITVDGREIPVRTRGRTVNEVLGEYGVNLGPGDEVAPEGDAPVVPGMRVHVARILTGTEEDMAAVDYDTKKQYTTRLPQGATRVSQEGREGSERRTWLVTYRDGKEVNRQLASREVISPPVDKVIIVGSGMVVSRGGEDIRYSSEVDMLATAYTHTGYNTAAGVAPHHGVAAVDTARIPFGTRLYVEGYGYATALDRGGDIKGNRIDLFFDSEAEALRWGARRVKVYILD